MIIKGGSNMTGTDVARFTHKQSRSYLNQLVIVKINKKRGFVRRNRGLFDSNAGPSHTKKKLQKYILKQPDTGELCRRCWKESEIIQHTTAACEQLAPTEYVKRHDGLAKIIHQKLAEAAELIDDKSPHYKYTPVNVLENESSKLYWNRSVLTDETITFKRPDITFMNKKTKNNFLIDIAVPDTHNIAKTITDKQNKYQEVANEICAMWKQKAAQVIPIVISSMRVIPKSLSQSLTILKLQPNTYIQLQKSVILGTCSIVRNFLNYK